MKNYAILLASAALCGCATIPSHTALSPIDTQVTDAWPQRAAPARDLAVEARIAAIVASMTLEQKVGQMTQAEIRSITPAEVREFHIGSILNGGGAWPAMDKHSTAAEWVILARQYEDAALASDLATPIPLIWGTDAVHGHNNVVGATIFPHNMGLGAAHDPDLVRRIGRSTARAVRATGIGWVFAPTLAVVKNQRWGRSYESYSSDPARVAANGAALVEGLQGDMTGGDDVLATAKHFVGDGGTWRGIDRGENRASLAEFAAVDGAGYYTSLDAGVATAMISYSSWDPSDGAPQGKMHGSRTLVTGVLRDRMGFDGLVVSDWNGIEEVPGCGKDRCAQAINAGIDLIMVPDDWKAFIANTITDVREGRIPMARIDDAVTRILRTKFTAGLFERGDAHGPLAGDASALEDRALGQEAVRKSVVLLKNDGVLPLARGKRILVTGASADSFSSQTGGWSLTWQGDNNVAADFTTGETLLAGLRRVFGKDNVTYSTDGSVPAGQSFDAVIAAVAEKPYAEMHGDVLYPAPLAFSSLYPDQAAGLARLAAAGTPVVTVLYSGRTIYSSDLINRSDAFLAGFLPGSEAGAIADVLAGSAGMDFTGRLSFAWPNTPCPSGGEPATETLFPLGYGLGLNDKSGERIAEVDIPATCH